MTDSSTHGIMTVPLTRSEPATAHAVDAPRLGVPPHEWIHH